MSTESIIKSHAANLSAAYDAIAELGGTVPEHKNYANLAMAIDSINTIKFFDVDFDLDGGQTTEPIPVQKVEEGKTATYPSQKPTRAEGERFIGWYDSAGPDGGQPDRDAGGTVHVMFRTDGGSPQPVGQEIVAGTTVDNPGPVEKDGFTFLGWYLAGEMPDEDVEGGE